MVDGYTDKEKGNVILSSNVTLTNGIFRHYRLGMGNIIFKDADFAALPIIEKLKQYPQILAESGYSGKPHVVTNEYEYPNGCYRLPSIVEYSRMMTIPDSYVSDIPDISNTQKLKMIGNSFTVDVIAHILSNLKNHSHE